MREVEVIKIGQIIPNLQPSVNKRVPTVMILDSDDPVVVHYLSIFKDYCKYYWSVSLLKTSESIIRPSGEDLYRLNMTKKSKNVKGRIDDEPQIGKSFTINNSSWHTSLVENIIDGNIIVTRNSVYALHDIGTMREQKLKTLVS